MVHKFYCRQQITRLFLFFMLHKIIKFSIVLIIIAGITIGGFFYYHHKKIFPSTDDAYIQANVIYIAPQVNGNVSTVYVTNHEFVKKGQLLFSLDPKSFKIALQRAEANLKNVVQEVQAAQSAVKMAKATVAEREAQLNELQKTYLRTMSLVKQHLYAVASGDSITRQLRVAKEALNAAKSQLQEAKQESGSPGKSNARIQAAQTVVAQAKLNLSYTRVVAPADGYIEKFTLQSGSEVSAYQAQFVIIESHSWWATANFKETDLERIKQGQPAMIKVDMYPHHPFEGVVSSISRGSGSSFALLPSENATGNWVKVTQRFPIRINIVNPDFDYPLRMGASCTVIVDTR